ncbi:MAG TPA: hypothetical protein VGM82_18505 [Gemmatimonadaceae bacterium]
MLIDLTDRRFFTPANAEVIEFIRRVNPFAHSDIGTVLFDCAREIPGAQAYCPSVASYAYVVVHTPVSGIVAIAYDRRRLAIRLSAASHADAIAAGNVETSAIGPEWIEINPWTLPRGSGQRSASDWVRQAYGELSAAECR